MARTPAKSKSARVDLRPTSIDHLIFSLRVMKLKLNLIAFSTTKV
jgi:hypothetical protein